MNRYYDIFETPLGWMGLLASDIGLRRSTLPQATPDECYLELGAEVADATNEPERFAELRDRLRRYFDGEHETFEDVAVDTSDASQFYRSAWKACQSIPYGETRTYGWLAEQAGNPRAPRAAGQSMARNWMPIIVPCHRVIGSNGSMTGFGKGAERIPLKRRLIAAETH